MPSNYWVKFYVEILDDPKMGQLSDRLWRRVAELFLAAGEINNEGTLPTIKDLSWRLRIDENLLYEDLSQLAELGITRHDEENDCWVVTNFARRQAPATGAERVKRFRDRKREKQYYGNENRNESVTTRYTDTDTDTDTEEDKEEKAQAPDNETPKNLDEWLELLTDTKNPNADLMLMFETLYPRATQKPSFGYLGKVSKQVGGAGRLAHLLWQCSSAQITGDVMRYVQGYHKNHKDEKPKKRRAQKPAKEVLEDLEDE